jgi:hypothetical protein
MAGEADIAGSPKCNVNMVLFYIFIEVLFVFGMLILLTFGIMYTTDNDPKKNHTGQYCLIGAMVMLVILFSIIAIQAGRS